MILQEDINGLIFFCNCCIAVRVDLRDEPQTVWKKMLQSCGCKKQTNSNKQQQQQIHMESCEHIETE